MKIAFISDIHFGKLSCTSEFSVPGEEIAVDEKNAAAFSAGLINLLRENDVDYLFIAGDLTSCGSPQEFYYCEDKILEIADKASIKLDNIFCAMGNHDIDWNIIDLAKQTDNKNEDVKTIILNKYQSIAYNAPNSVLIRMPRPQILGPMPFSGIIERDFILFVLNSSCFCSPSQYNKHGRLDNEQLIWFEDKLKKYENDPRTKIVMLHHHPIHYPYPILCEDPSLLEEGSELVSICGKYGVNMILHGHRHHPRVKTDMENGWKHPITFICAGSLSVESKHRSDGTIPNTAHIIDMSQAPACFVLYNYEYSKTKGWIPLRDNREETPIDAKMRLGKVFNESELITAISECVVAAENPIIVQYDNLPEPLLYCTYNRLNHLVAEVLSSDYIICGRFPDIVSFTRKEEKV